MQKTVNLTGKKIAAIALSAVLLVGGSVAGTMAYLQSSDSVTNTFTVGQVHIKLDEAKANADGTLVDGAARVDANAYHLIPGISYAKDPMVTVLANSENAYVKMTVTVNMSKELDAIFGQGGANLMSIFEGYDANTWIYQGNVENTAANTRTYEFWYKTTVSTVGAADKALEPLFTKVTVPGNLSNEQLATLVVKNDAGEITSQLTITVNAYAVQAAGFTDMDKDGVVADDAFAAAFGA